MPKKMTIKEAIDRREKAQIAYGRSVREFRSCHAELAALDRLLQPLGIGHHQGFGEPPTAVSLRHVVVHPDVPNAGLHPDVSGGLGQDADEVFSTLQLVEG